MFWFVSKYLFDIYMCVRRGLCVRTSSPFVPVCPQIFCQSVCVLKVSVHMNHLSVIGTENHVGQRINRPPDYAEYSLSDSNSEKKNPSVPAAVGILISSRSRSLLAF